MDGIVTHLAPHEFPVEVVPLVAVKELQDGWKSEEYKVPPSMQKAIVRTDTITITHPHRHHQQHPQCRHHHLLHLSLGYHPVQEKHNQSHRLYDFHH